MLVGVGKEVPVVSQQPDLLQPLHDALALLPCDGGDAVGQVGGGDAAHRGLQRIGQV